MLRIYFPALLGFTKNSKRAQNGQNNGSFGTEGNGENRGTELELQVSGSTERVKTPR